MLRGVPPAITPELLAAMWRMGHGDTIVLCDAHFPAARLARGRENRLDPVGMVELTAAVLQLLVLDAYGPPPVTLMAPEPGDTIDAVFRTRLIDTISAWSPTGDEVRLLARQDFYDEAAVAEVVVATGETATYANVILRKGVTPVRGNRGRMSAPEPRGARMLPGRAPASDYDTEAEASTPCPDG